MARPQPCLPNLLVIGARKCGTSSLHYYLSLHPQIFMSKQKELSFFDARNRWGLGVEWYKSNFDASYVINGETSPQYSRYPRTPDVPERIKQVLGSPKLIYLIRDPVDRILSDYVQIVETSAATAPFDAILPNIEEDPEEYIQGSSYFLQVSQYLKHFPRENILVVLQERLNSDRRDSLRRIFKFLGVDQEFWAPEFNNRKNVGEAKRFVAPWFNRLVSSEIQSKLRHSTTIPWTINRFIRFKVSRIGGAPIEKPKLSEADDIRLQRALRSDVAALRQFLGDSLPEWRPYA